PVLVGRQQPGSYPEWWGPGNAASTEVKLLDASSHLQGLGLGQFSLCAGLCLCLPERWALKTCLYPHVSGSPSCPLPLVPQLHTPGPPSGGLMAGAVDISPRRWCYLLCSQPRAREFRAVPMPCSEMAVPTGVAGAEGTEVRCSHGLVLHSRRTLDLSVDGLCEANKDRQGLGLGRMPRHEDPEPEDSGVPSSLSSPDTTLGDHSV
ncbi:hypothetical protein J0S82_016436, partial [Galemys pyrenaicus]